MRTSEIYREELLDHYRHPRHYGELANPDVSVHESNPLCGDEITLQLVFGADRQLTDARFTGRGCVLTMASTSMLLERFTGKSWQEVQAIDQAQLVAMLGVEVPTVRMKCVNVALDALRQALTVYAQGADRGPATVAALASTAHAHGLLDHIGHTPLLRLNATAWNIPPRVQVFAKLELRNPGGTAKVRSVSAAIRAARHAKPALLPGMALLDVMTGSAGIALAVIGAQLGMTTKLIVPAGVSDDAKRLLRAYGAQLHVLVDPTIDAHGAAQLAHEVSRKSAGRVYFLDTFNQPATREVHYATTGVEILAQLAEPISHFVAGVGSGATLAGVARRLKEHTPTIRVFGVVPASANDRIEGLRGAITPTSPSTIEADLQDGTLEVTAAESEACAKQLAKREGLLAGTSSGAALAASLRLASQLDAGTIVTVFPDDGQRYLGEPYWQNDY
jgi:cysteine synthase B